jgi:uncharacterized protein YuzE
MNRRIKEGCVKMTKEFRMKQDYDKENDILFLKSQEHYEYKESLELGTNVILDFDKNYVPVALEILDASELLKVDKSSLKNLEHLEMTVEINEDLVLVKAFFLVSLNKKTVEKPFDAKTINDISLPHMQAHFELVKV